MSARVRAAARLESDEDLARLQRVAVRAVGRNSGDQNAVEEFGRAVGIFISWHQVASLVRSIHAAVLSALNLAGSARWKHRGVIRILKVGALTVDYHLIGPANLGDGDRCADHCAYREPSASRGQKCGDGSESWARVTALCAVGEWHVSG